MTTEEEFEKWMDTNADSWREATSPFVKDCVILLREAYLQGTKATAQRCVEICLANADYGCPVAKRCAAAIREQFLP